MAVSMNLILNSSYIFVAIESVVAGDDGDIGDGGGVSHRERKENYNEGE